MKTGIFLFAIVLSLFSRPDGRHAGRRELLVPERSASEPLHPPGRIRGGCDVDPEGGQEPQGSSLVGEQRGVSALAPLHASLWASAQDEVPMSRCSVLHGRLENGAGVPRLG